MPRSEDQLAARLPAARDGAVSAGHLPPVQRHGTALDRVVKERGETGEAELLIDCEECATSADAFRIGSG
jgi:hypothetical protein